MVSFGKHLAATETPIPGLVVWDLPVHGDNRGWFKENWHREKMVAAGLPDFDPVQNNIAFNDARGTTRGIHAEPWDKFVSVASGLVFGAWVDLREGPSFGTVYTTELDPSRAIFVPRGVGNAYQTLAAGTSYVYLVNDHWSPEAAYTFLNLGDETSAIAWPIPLVEAEVSAKDRSHPRLVDVKPMVDRKVLVLGSGGQLGRALRDTLGESGSIEYTDRGDLDISDPSLATARRWRDYRTIINAAAYTAVDAAERADSRPEAWAANASGVARLARVCNENGLTLVHISSDYVFDGTLDRPYLEDDPLSPLGVYAQSKAAGDCAVAVAPRHYILRTSWVVGNGRNFVTTMTSLAERGINPSVVDDQVGRLTFAGDIARAIDHLLTTRAPFGTYNLTGDGEPVSWAAVARRVFELTGHDPARIKPVPTSQYPSAAPRPTNSVLDLSKIKATSFQPTNWDEGLKRFLETSN